MKLSAIFTILTFGEIVKGWAAYLRPIVLSIGAAITAIDLDIGPLFDIQPIKSPTWLYSYEKEWWKNKAEQNPNSIKNNKKPEMTEEEEKEQ